MTKKSTRKISTPEPTQGAVAKSVSSVLEPLFGLIFDSGMSVPEFAEILRRVAVDCALRTLSTAGIRPSKSAAAIMTGLPRSEVARLIKPGRSHEASRKSRMNVRARILDAWHEDPRFTTKTGAALTLPIFGKKKSFEYLAAIYSPGTPVRALLEQLLHLGVIEQVPNQAVRPVTRNLGKNSLSLTSIQTLGTQGQDALKALINDARGMRKSSYFHDALASKVEIERVRALMESGDIAVGTLIETMCSAVRKKQLSKSSFTGITNVEPYRLGMLIYYVADQKLKSADSGSDKGFTSRKNLTRKKQPIS